MQRLNLRKSQFGRYLSVVKNLSHMVFDHLLNPPSIISEVFDHLGSTVLPRFLSLFVRWSNTGQILVKYLVYDWSNTLVKYPIPYRDIG